MSKPLLTLLIFVLIPSFAFSQKTESSLNSYKADLLSEIETISDEQQKHDKLVEAARLLELTGELNRAADLFKQASLAIKGKKDFNSLYRSAVINIETDFLREAEADLRAIILFSDDTDLRIKSGVLTARIKNLQGMPEEAKELLTDLLLTYEELPYEAVRFASELFTDEELAAISNKRTAALPAAAYTDSSPLLSPETVFGGTAGGVLFSEGLTAPAGGSESGTETPSSDEDIDAVTVVSIQLGSFSVRENAEELKKSVSAAGWEAVIKPKTVNGKQYFTVTVPVAEDQPVQTLVIRLKEKGFEGYPVY